MVLKGIKVVEMMGLAPGPFCGTILADFGASVTVVQKLEASSLDVMSHGKKMISVNLKTEKGVDVVRRLCAKSDVLIDTFRPGVMEKLGLGPENLLKDNSRLIYARLSGYGQDGNYRNKAGHDINYVSISGILSALCKRGEPPVPPLNLLADFAGGSLMCAFGIVLALYERVKSGKGQVIDASMTEGAGYLATWIFKSKNLPIWSGEPGTNALDGGLACYRTYKTKDNKFMAVGALEPQFYTNFLAGLQLSEDVYGQFSDLEHCTKKFEEVFLTKTQIEWCQIFDELDACVTPVVDLQSADENDCNKSRHSFYRNSDNELIPEAAPKLSRTPGQSVGREPLPGPGQHTIDILKELGFTNIEINKLITEGCVYAKKKSNL
ncbi:alpha-methylacyl-CoA racemase [Pectinophora gossypiella]|uniref:alpha-methylacyl-CoA racemase n=1 Tax=Pectinophora gossypiella TaxID=13191 RepID=UPI00214F17CA|nr:alpha-methylacyl-CoA racemase [Pectinophora gossypiella]